MRTFSDSNMREAQLVAAARTGETTGLVEYVYEHCLPSQAARLVSGFRAAYGAHLEVEDVVQFGIENVLRSLDKALVASNPIAWLRHMAQLQMLHYCQEARSSIRVPYSSQSQGIGRVPTITSLDAILPGCDDLTLLDTIAAPDGLYV